jgi:hypothetical protein
MASTPTGNVIYPLWRSVLVQEAQPSKSLDQTDVNNAVYCALLHCGSPGESLGYTYSATHQFYTDLQMAPTVGSGHESAVFNASGPLDKQITTPTVNTGIFDGDDLTFLVITTVVAGFNSVDALVLYRRNAGASSAWRLVYYCDTGAGFPVIPNGGNITITWNAAGIFTL